jgi:hypothetical protein
MSIQNYPVVFDIQPKMAAIEAQSYDIKHSTLTELASPGLS